MRVRELKEEFPWTTEQTEQRLKGKLHVTGIIRAMEKGIQETSGKELSDETRMQFEKGWLWEVALSRAFGEKCAHRIGEIELDGIVGSPDGIRYDDPAELIPIVEEYKCTAYSPNKPITDHWRWMMQAKAYCKMVGATKCVFRVLHLSFVPMYRVWELVFSQRELDENWEAILNQAKVMKGE
jgi:hypothetical protein